MSAVDVEISEDAPDEGASGEGARASEASGESQGRRRRSRGAPVEVEIEREVTKRQLIQSISSIVVVVLYMVFTLLRDRDAGVVVLDPEDASDDWDEA